MKIYFVILLFLSHNLLSQDFSGAESQSMGTNVAVMEGIWSMNGKRWRVHTLVLSENPAVNLQKILQSVRFDRLLIDATNPDYKIRQWLAEAKNLHLQVHVLKKSPAIRIAL